MLIDFRLIAKGARGGRGALVSPMTSHGSIAKTTMYLRKGEQIFILVGQEGGSACDPVSLHCVLYPCSFLILTFPRKL